MAAEEEKYAGYMTMRIKNCMDAMTISPCEGQNKVFKHGPNKTNGNFHLNILLTKIVQSTLKQLRRRLRAAKRESVQINNASNAPTRCDQIRKGRDLGDRSHDRCLHQKLAQVGPKR